MEGWRDKESGRQGEWETRRVGDKESGRQGEWETRRQGDKESGRQGDKETLITYTANLKGTIIW
jgi:hypothetical protein